MSGWKLGLALLPALGGILVAVAARADPRADRIVALAIGAYCAGLILLWIRRETSADPPAAAAPRRETVRPLAQLAQVERSVAIARNTAVEFEHRVQPRLRRTAAERLQLRHGVDLEGDPDAARRLLGDAAWDLLTARHGAEDRAAPAPPPQAILAAIETLEEV